MSADIGDATRAWEDAQERLRESGEADAPPEPDAWHRRADDAYRLRDLARYLADDISTPLYLSRNRERVADLARKLARDIDNLAYELAERSRTFGDIADD